MCLAMREMISEIVKNEILFCKLNKPTSIKTSEIVLTGLIEMETTPQYTLYHKKSKPQAMALNTAVIILG